jgi:hypothetical protein
VQRIHPTIIRTRLYSSQCTLKLVRLRDRMGEKPKTKFDMCLLDEKLMLNLTLNQNTKTTNCYSFKLSYLTERVTFEILTRSLKNECIERVEGSIWTFLVAPLPVIRHDIHSRHPEFNPSGSGVRPFLFLFFFLVQITFVSLQTLGTLEKADQEKDL